MIFYSHNPIKDWKPNSLYKNEFRTDHFYEHRKNNSGHQSPKEHHALIVGS